MIKGDIFIEVYLGFLILGAIGVIAYPIINYIKKRHETEQEKEIREANELEKYEKQQRLNRKFGGFVSLLGYLCVIGAAIMFLYQCYHWLKHGQWLEIPFSSILSRLDISISDIGQYQWKGIAKLLLWVSHQSSALVVATSGFIIAIIGNILRN